MLANNPYSHLGLFQTPHSTNLPYSFEALFPYLKSPKLSTNNKSPRAALQDNMDIRHSDFFSTPQGMQSMITFPESTRAFMQPLLFGGPPSAKKNFTFFKDSGVDVSPSFGALDSSKHQDLPSFHTLPSITPNAGAISKGFDFTGLNDIDHFNRDLDEHQLDQNNSASPLIKLDDSSSPYLLQNEEQLDADNNSPNKTRKSFLQVGLRKPPGINLDLINDESLIRQSWGNQQVKQSTPTPSSAPKDKQFNDNMVGSSESAGNNQQVKIENLNNEAPSSEVNSKGSKKSETGSVHTPTGNVIKPMTLKNLGSSSPLSLGPMPSISPGRMIIPSPHSGFTIFSRKKGNKSQNEEDEDKSEERTEEKSERDALQEE